MTQDEIIEMAKEAGLYIATDTNWMPVIGLAYAKKLVEVAAQHEREASADIAEKQRYAMLISLTSHPAQNGTAVGIANQIRARGEA